MNTIHTRGNTNADCRLSSNVLTTFADSNADVVLVNHPIQRLPNGQDGISGRVLGRTFEVCAHSPLERLVFLPNPALFERHENIR